MRNRSIAVAAVVLVCAQAPAFASSSGQAPAGQEAPPRPSGQRQGLVQPGASQGVPTTEGDPVKKFDMDYFVGEWKFEGNLAETPVSPGGPSSGTERVANVQDGRFWEITIRGEGDTPSGKGVIFYQDSFSGQFFTRYEVVGGAAMIKTGTLGCDHGSVCNMYFETPSFEHDGKLLRLRGRYYITSPLSYRLSMEISIDKGPFTNVGTTFYTKDEKVKVTVVK